MAQNRKPENNARNTETPGCSPSAGRPHGQLDAAPRSRRLAWLGPAAMAVLAAGMLLASFAPYDAWPLAYVALVPWVLAVALAPTRRGGLLAGWLGGVAFWLAGLYWLWWITLAGYFALAAYASVYWLVVAAVVRAAAGRGLPLWVVLPLTWAPLEFLRGWLASGFPWFMLAHSQYLQTPLIQISDVTGAYGVSFFVAMVNGALADVALAVLAWRKDRAAALAAGQPPRRLRLGPAAVGGLAAVVLATGGLLGYGYMRLGENTQSAGPSIGIVQEKYPIALDQEPVPSSVALKAHLELSRRLEGLGADLVVWPETMLPQGLNPDFYTRPLESFSDSDVAMLINRHEIKASIGDRELLGNWLHNASVAAEVVAVQSRRLDAPILAGGATVVRNETPAYPSDRWLVRNSALWFDRDGPSPRTYSKIHLVPFGEYVPFKTSALWLHQWLRALVPPQMTQLDAGGEPALFELTRGPSTWRLATPICYEGVFARDVSRLVSPGGVKRADIIVNMSNDGWFVWAWGAPRGSSEHDQHLAQYVFRAVENRTPVVRAVNTGISASIDSNGRLVAVLQRDGVRSSVSGVMLLGGGGTRPQVVGGPRVLVDSRVAVYSTAGDVFAGSAAATGALLAGWLALGALAARKRGAA